MRKKTEDGASRLSVRLERQQFEEWATDARPMSDMESLFAWEAWNAATLIEREACKHDFITVIEKRNHEDCWLRIADIRNGHKRVIEFEATATPRARVPWLASQTESQGNRGD